jgi:DNA-binding transcriptional regulator YhcF (GntR family)
LQLKYQLSYLITSGELPEGTKLPPVRELARQLEINPGTVVQAYRELQQDGLVVSTQGRGTFVAPMIAYQPDAAVRQSLLTETLQEAQKRARALGFSDAEIQQRFVSLLNHTPRICHVAFVGPTVAIARKYAARLEHHLGEGIRAIPLTIQDLEAGDSSALAPLEYVYYVVTFALQLKRIEGLLTKRGYTCRVLGIATQVVDETLQALSALRGDLRVCLVTQERYLHVSLNLILGHSPIREKQIRAVFDTDPDFIPQATANADLIIYTFGVRDLLDALGIPEEKRLELVFDISPDSLLKLKALLTPDTTPVYA